MTIDDHIPNTAKPIKPHPDDVAVDNFAVAMKEKLAIARGKGRSGWEECDPVHLSAMLYEHVAKGDPRDVANFCMFLWNLGQPITQCNKAPAVAQEPENSLRTDALCQLSYCNGLKAGWNFCVDDNEAGYSNAMNGIVEAVRVLKQNRDTEAPAVAVNERLLRAAKKYFMSYCRDEASEFGPDDTGCSQEQHKDALEFGEAIAAAEVAKRGG